MRMKSVYVTVMYLLLISVNYANCNCTLILNTDFGQPSPVYIKNGTYLAPKSLTGDVYVRRSDTLLVGCPGTKNYVVLGTEKTGTDTVNVQCVTGNIFRAGRWRGEFKDIRCAAVPSFKAEETTSKCGGNHKLYRVGYHILNNFHTLYEACFNRKLLSTLYVRHQLTPYSDVTQNSTHRPQFLEGNVFGKIRMSKVYTLQNQRMRLNAILGGNLDQVYITKTQALRRRISKYGSPVTVVTGTHGVCTLPDERGHPQELFLHEDENNNRVIPVPLYLYKLVYDSLKKTAVAFISINSSYYNSTTLDRLTFCNDICHSDSRYSWLSWRSRDNRQSFCCSYEQFARVINYLPNLNVEGLFY